MAKNPPVHAGDVGLIPGLVRSPGEGNGNLTLVFLPGKSHRQRSLMIYSPWGLKRIGQNLRTKTTIVHHCLIHNSYMTHVLEKSKGRNKEGREKGSKVTLFHKMN